MYFYEHSIISMRLGRIVAETRLHYTSTELLDKTEAYIEGMRGKLLDRVWCKNSANRYGLSNTVALQYPKKSSG